MFTAIRLCLSKTDISTYRNHKRIPREKLIIIAKAILIQQQEMMWNM